MSQFLNIDLGTNQKLEYDISGDENSECLVFMHGGGVDHKYYDSFVKELSKTYRVFAFSNPGFGKSTPIKKYTIAHMNQIIDSFVEAMKIKDFILVGHSLGAGFSLGYAAHNKKYNITKLVLISPFIFPITENLPKFVLNLAKDGRIEREHLPVFKSKKTAVKFMYKYVATAYQSFKLYLFLKTNDLSKYLKDIKVRTLGIIGLDDIVLSVSLQKKGLEQIDNVKILEYTGSGHDLLFSKKAEILKEIEIL